MRTLVFTALALLLSTSLSAATPEEEIRAVAQAWVEGIGKGDADYMTSLYADDAILHGTTSPVLREGHALIREYFANIAANPPTMSFIEPMHIRIYGDTAINTGNYATRFNAEQEPIVLRYSFVYHKFPEGWKIVDHHSSRMPQ
jgi:uncharacterized protein (TIGR02246 family)